MIHQETGFDCLFIINRWLAEDKEDGQLYRECAFETPNVIMPTPGVTKNKKNHLIFD